MGLRPGESDCSLCVKRPLAEGGSGSCPITSPALLAAYRERKYDCLKFREGDYVTKREKKHLELNPQSEGLF